MVIQDHSELTYFDDYRYDGTSFFSKWEKGEPYKEGTEAETIDFSELKVDGFYKFYQQIIDYLKNGNDEVEEDNLIQIRVVIPVDGASPYLRSWGSGIRKDFSFKADFSGINFVKED